MSEVYHFEFCLSTNCELITSKPIITPCVYAFRSLQLLQAVINMFRIRIRELREQAGYRSQQSFADVFGVAKSTIGNWEAGKREPNYETTIRLADFFHVSVDYLLGTSNLHSGVTSPPCFSWSGNELRSLRIQTGESIKDTSTAVHLTVEDYTRLENGSFAPCLDVLCRLADHFCVVLDHLIGRIWTLCGTDKYATHSFCITDNEKNLIKCYRTASVEDRAIIDNIIQRYTQSEDRHHNTV